MDSADQSLLNRRRQRLKATVALWICLTVPWGVWPVLFPPAFKNPISSYAWNVREQYPFHLVKPEWLKVDYYYDGDPYARDWDWPVAETEARVAIVLIGIGVLVLWTKRVRFPRFQPTKTAGAGLQTTQEG